MTISTADRLAIHELLALHGHLSDAGAFDRMTEVFTDDVVYDMNEYGAGLVHGLAALRDMAIELGDRNPVGHHVTNIIIAATDGDTVLVRAKGIGVATDGTVGSVTYDDIVRRTPDGWRIAHRRVVPRRRPLAP
ncbi:3-phenylpropionate/cinnamic acid dioxygenase small subunit [Nocardia transvalensis]|uniref:3-phenylpropionate/cinnamic acid dioxygenase small subunit n=1 Tax=Nocardia transvalensis TaxID=37333 RepID=A0A7W9P9K8_9NOCA|nr:nuclear transport factor 2 family protein [Nocardia transvalensis]MBB5911875.1 3-phenylpropionate/cinnamic acid dioxygenase small subunit [Nocardia transvalensis]